MTTAQCDRARYWVSLQLDGAISELEARLLDRHLGGCEACRLFAADAAAQTAYLRALPLEPIPAFVSLPARHRRARGAARGVVGVAAVAASVALALVTTGTHRPEINQRSNPLDLAVVPAPRSDNLGVQRFTVSRHRPQVPLDKQRHVRVLGHSEP